MPWFLLIISLIIEISTGNFLFFTLYFLSLNFFVKRCLRFIIYLVNQENNKFLEIIIKENNISYFYAWTIYQDFSLINGTIQWNLYFLNKNIQNKATITYLWTFFQTFSFLRVNSKLISQFIKSHLLFWNILTQKIQLFLLFLILILKTSFFNLIEETSKFYNLCFVFSIFITVIFCFFSYLKFLKTFSVFTEDDWQKFKTPKELLAHFSHHQECFLHFFEEKLNFLNNKDLTSGHLQILKKILRPFFTKILKKIV